MAIELLLFGGALTTASLFNHARTTDQTTTRTKNVEAHIEYFFGAVLFFFAVPLDAPIFIGFAIALYLVGITLAWKVGESYTIPSVYPS